MQDNIMQAAMQPYIKLVQANLELMAKFSTSPEMAAQFAAMTQSLLRQAGESGSGLMQSGALAQLAQGMLQNYTTFLTEVGQSGMAMLAQGQAAMTRQVQEASGKVLGGSKAGG